MTASTPCACSRSHTLSKARSLFSSTPRTHLLLEFFHELNVPDWAAVRTKRAQYIEYYGLHRRVTFREFYDLDSDRWQLSNLLRVGGKADAGRASRLRAMLSQVRSCAGSRCP